MKKRIVALLLVVATLLSMIGAGVPTDVASDEPTTAQVETTVEPTPTPEVTVEPTPTPEVTPIPEVTPPPIAENTGEIATCTVCQADPCICETNEEICDKCEHDPCICTIWETVGEAQDVTLIGYLNKTADTIVFFDDNEKDWTVASGDCPDFVVLKSVYPDQESGEPVFYIADSFDLNFWDSVIAYAQYIKADQFSTVVPAVGLYATVSPNAGNVTLYRDLGVATDAKFVSAADLNGEYVVAELFYEDTLNDWFVKLTADENWPEDAEEYVWISAAALASLSRTPTQQPDEPVCDICGKTDCNGVHRYCTVCENYTCTETHLYCVVCKKYDCPISHKYCTFCDKYDCGIDHAAEFKPVTAPVIPDYTLPEGTDSAIVNENGETITDGLHVPKGTKVSLSAWSVLDDAADVTYQWQIRYDAFNDLWADIHGQTGKGILVSPAMVQSIIDLQGSAAIRCVTTAGEETVESAAIPVSIVSDSAIMSAGRINSPAYNAAALAEDGDQSAELHEVYIVVQYLYSDGRTAAAADFQEIIPEQGHHYSYSLPSIPGYKATLDTHSFGDRVTLNGNTLSMNFAANELTEEYTIFTVTYAPDFVDYTVIHKWQNVDDDHYTEHERETISNVHKTGEVISDAHNAYDGFYHLLYETPAAAADGSTVIEVYYDRYYYLMTFNLGDGGYGTRPIYARCGADLEITEPTRAGYIFSGWELNGVTVDQMPTTMPAESREYVAVWKPVDTAKVSVVFWGENANDTEFSYIGTEQFDVKPGTTITWADGGRICGLEEHTHGSTCDTNCGYVEHTHGVACYKLTCGKTIHTHSTACCTKASEIHSLGTTCYDGAQKSTGYPGLGTPNNPANGYIARKALSIDSLVIYINGTWYDYNGSINQGAIATTNCNGIHSHSDHTCVYCNLPEHTEHTDDCYELTCTTPEHKHLAACLSCGKPEHTHTSKCNATTTLIDTDLWDFLESETVTVDPDGSTVLNVKYTRKQFSVNFYSKSSLADSSEYTNYRITAKWGATILDKWPKHNGSSSWYVANKDGNWQNSIQIMPVGGAKFYGPKTGNNSYNAYYYVEALPGDTDTIVHNGVTYRLHHTDTSSSSGNVTDEERYDIEGFVYKEGTSNGSSYNNAKFYYIRHKYAIEFYNPTNQIKKITGIPYQSNLGAYDYTPTAADAPDVYEPNSVKFAGWYLSPQCTGDRYILADHTMPSAPKNGDTSVVLYAKWEPVEYKVNYYLTKDSLDRGENIPTEMARRIQEAITAGTISQKPATDPYTEAFHEDIVKHGAHVPTPANPGVSEGYEKIHPRTGYEFIGWFYVNDEGKETAYDPVNVPVYHDMNLYAKWSSNVLCKYNVHFALYDANNNGTSDVEEGIPLTYIADSISGSAIAGRTYTFTAKGGDDLYDPDGEINYQEGYFPTTGSHSIIINISDEHGTGANSYTFLYKPKAAVPYAVRYVDKDTGETLFADKVVSDNKNVVVTENFLSMSGYMPDAYQKTLVVTDDGDESNDIITFYYTKDTKHALYVVNYYIQDLDSDLKHAGWTKYTDLQHTGDIGTAYSAEAITIDGFTLSESYTNDYNVKKINAAEKDENGAYKILPAVVSKLTTADGKSTITGTLTDKGMELNFYYTRNLYPYEFRYMLNGTTTKLAPTKVGKAGYDTIVTEAAKEIKMDLDSDGVNEDYRLFDPTEVTKDIHIKTDGEPLNSDAEVSEGQATVNVATFYYVRCTQTMTIKKEVVDESDTSDPDPDQEFTFSLLIHSTNGYHQTSYAYKNSNGNSGTISPKMPARNTLQFTLKAGETITIEGLPTAEYTVTELNVPAGYDDSYSPAQKNTLTVNEQLDVTVTNTYKPATLTVSKAAKSASTDYTVPDNAEFTFLFTFSDGVAHAYTRSDNSTGTVASGGTLKLKHGESVRIDNIAPGVTYTVEEIDLPTYFTSSNSIASGTVAFGEDYTEAFTNVYTLPKVDYTVKYLEQGTNIELAEATTGQEYVSKEVTVSAKDVDGYTASQKALTQTIENDKNIIIFYYTRDTGILQITKDITVMEGGINPNPSSFTFEVSSVTDGFIDGKTYDVTINETSAGTATVSNRKLQVTLSDMQYNEDRVIKITNLPTGQYTVTELPSLGFGTNFNADSDYENSVTVEIAKGKQASVNCNNIFPVYVGALKLTKAVDKEYAQDVIPADAEFEFTITLKPKSEVLELFTKFTYTYQINDGAEQTATVDFGTETTANITMKLKAADTVYIQGLPVGTYSITETQDSRFTATMEGESGQITTSVTPEAVFTNTYKRTTGNLQITKIVDNTTELPLKKETFTFIINMPSGLKYSSYKDVISVPEGTTIEAVDDDDTKFKVKIKFDEDFVVGSGADADKPKNRKSLTISRLPSGDYAVEEVIVPGYGPAWTNNDNVAEVRGGQTAVLTCTNTYPVYNAKLTIVQRNMTSQADSGIYEVVDSSDTVIAKVMITGNTYVTLDAVPIGTYTIKEITSEWTWTYDPDNDADPLTFEVSAAGPNTVTFNHSAKTVDWLHSENAK